MHDPLRQIQVPNRIVGGLGRQSIALFALAYFGGRFLPQLRQLEVALHASQQLPGTEGLGEVVVRTGLQPFQAGFLPGAGRQQDDRNGSASPARHATARNSPKPSTRGIITSAEHQVRRSAAYGLQGRLAVRHRLDLYCAPAIAARTRACRRCRRPAACVHGVRRAAAIHTGSGRRSTPASSRPPASSLPAAIAGPLPRTPRRRSRSKPPTARPWMRSAGRCALPNGMATVKVAARASIALHRIAPPCSRTSSWTSARPMPCPRRCAPARPSTRWNRSNRRGSSPAGMPTPVSRTVSTAAPPSRPHRRPRFRPRR